MQFRIKKGKHRARPLRLGLWLNKTIIRKLVSFDFSCKYQFADDDQNDHNKLFGIGYLFSLGKDSARFGWRYSNEKRMFIISAYCHINGQRFFKDICDVTAAKNYIMEININPKFYEFVVSHADSNLMVARYSIAKNHNRKWAYPMGFYFGGNKKAPHNMTINLKNV